jgi:hypothetical protein
MVASLVLARRHQRDEPAEEFYRRRGSAGSELVFENPRASWKSQGGVSNDGRAFLLYSICAVDVRPTAGPPSRS